MVGRTNSLRSKTNRRLFYLARGDFEWPGSTDLMHPCPAGTRRVEDPIAKPRQSLANARVLMLEAVDDLAPEVLRGLRALLPTLVRSGWNSEDDGLLTYEALQADPRLRTLRAAVDEWSMLSHLTDPWCVQIALSTLTNKRYDGQFEWYDAQVHLGLPDRFHVRFAAPFGLPAYDPVSMRRAEYLARFRSRMNPRYQKLSAELNNDIDSWRHAESDDEEYLLRNRIRELADRLPLRCEISDDCERQILDYVERVEAEARRQGLVPAPQGFRQPQIFQWLAGHQVLGWTPRQIAKATRVYTNLGDYHTHPNTIVYGIKKMSAYIGLSLRKDGIPSLRGVKLDTLVNEIREAIDRTGFDEQRQRRSRPPALTSDDVVHEVP